LANPASITGSIDARNTVIGTNFVHHSTYYILLLIFNRHMWTIKFERFGRIK
jgi:hypothetical protein